MSRPARARGEEGSALVLAIFVLVLLTGMGVALLSVSETEMKTSAVDLRAKQAFFFAEAGLEHGRDALRALNLADTDPDLRANLSDELAQAAGPDGEIDFDPALLTPVYDGARNVTGFSGYGDDQPLLALTTFAGGRYAAFLTNDPLEGRTNGTDTDLRAALTAIGTGPGGAVEVVEAIVERYPIPQFPATITIVGPSAGFDGGHSNAKEYTGDDCAIPGLSLPVVGVIGSASETSAEAGVHKPDSYTEGVQIGEDTVDNIAATIHPLWTDCNYLHDLARGIRAAADVVGTSSTSTSLLGVPGAPKVVYIEGDYSVGGGFDGAGLLLVTGTLTFHGNAAWSGVILTIGKGDFRRTGGGNGEISGANFVANVAGPDGLMWTGDDCSGADGVPGTADDGLESATYDNSGGGTGLTEYCTNAITSVEELFPFPVVQFRQR